MMSTSRGARALFRFMENHHPKKKFNLILLDYFRFPGPYMDEAYHSICHRNHFLDQLYNYHLLDAKVKIYIPALKKKEPFFGLSSSPIFAMQNVDDVATHNP
jgi:hypothetical protein